MNAAYIREIEALVEKVTTNNLAIAFFAERLRGKVPTQAASEFLTNKEQGDWAEELVLQILNRNLKGFSGFSYGRKDSIVAGDPEFKKFYQDYQIELDRIGKCPDILIYDNRTATEVQSELNSSKPREAIKETAQKAVAALEVRSSAFLTLQYLEFIKGKPQTGKKSKNREFLSFTPKVEDLIVILKWIQVHGVPHYYVQVFFDRIYAIPFKKILQILSDKNNLHTKYYIEKNSKNQFKSTIHINLDEGACIAQEVKVPKHTSATKQLPRGRILFYVKFTVDELPKVKETDLITAFDLQ